MLALISSAATTLTADYASTVSNLKPVAFWRLNESTQPPAADVAVNAGSLSDSGFEARTRRMSYPAGNDHCFAVPL